MRTTTGPEDTRLSAATYQVNYRVKVANGSGTMKDWSAWVESVETDENIDQPVEQMDIMFRRDFGSTLSLNPLKTDSTLNVLDDNVTFGPAIDVGRAITWESATTPIGTAPVSGDWKLLFTGTIDDLDFEKPSMKAVCRDQGGDIVDAWVETEVAYPAIGSLEAGIQRVLDARFGASVIPLNTPVSPGYALNAYGQQIESVATAVEALEQLTGWDVRYLWDNGSSTYKYTLWDPGRSKVTPDYTFGPSRILSVNKLGFQKRSIRNVIIVSYKDVTTGTRQTVTLSDATSITRYKRQVMLIIEPDDSPINSSTQATTMGNNALSDLKDPKAEFEIEMFHWWPAMLNDLYRFTANVRWFNTNQDWAVVGIRHHIALGEHRTILTVRGKPTGGYDSWINRSDPHGNPSVPNVNLKAGITQGATFTDTQESVIFSADGGDAPLQWRWRAVDSRTGAGAWSAWLANSGGNLLPHEQLITRGARWNKIIEFQYQDGAAKFSNIPSYVVDGVFDSLDTTTGRVRRAIPTDDGDYTTRSTTSNGFTLHTSAVESGLKLVNRLFAKPLSSSPDHLDSVGDGSTYSRILGSRLSGGTILRSGAYSDGDYALRATTSTGLNAHASSVESGGKAINTLFAKPLSSSPDDMGSVADSLTRFAAIQANADHTGSNVAYGITAIPCVLHDTTTPTIGTGTPSALSWNTEDVDASGMHSAGADSVSVLTTGGLVIIYASIRWPSSNTLGLRELRLYKNGSQIFDVLSETRSTANAGQFFQQHTWYDYAPSSGDFYQIVAYQDSGSTIAVEGKRFSVIHLRG